MCLLYSSRFYTKIPWQELELVLNAIGGTWRKKRITKARSCRESLVAIVEAGQWRVVGGVGSQRSEATQRNANQIKWVFLNACYCIFPRHYEGKNGTTTRTRKHESTQTTLGTTSRDRNIFIYQLNEVCCCCCDEGLKREELRLTH